MNTQIAGRLTQAGVEISKTARGLWQWALNYDPATYAPELWRIERGFPTFEAAALDAAEQLGLDYTVSA